MSHKFGTLEPVHYFRNYGDKTRPSGWLVLAAYSRNHPDLPGYERCAAESLAEIDRLEKTLYEQELAERSADVIHDERTFGPMRDKVRDNLYAQLVSSGTSQIEKDFIRAYLSYRIDKRDKFHAKYLEFVTYFHARNFDTPRNRPVDSERFSTDRINF